jgi:hypothetical protein
MAGKLQSILKQAHWSLATKGFLFGAAWLSTPAWFFVLAAFLLYLKPFFQPAKLMRSFLILLGTAFTFRDIIPAIQDFSPSISYFAALYFGALFFMLLGIKNLVFLHRIERYFMFYNGLLLAVFISVFWHLKPAEPLQFLIISTLFVASVILILSEFLELLRDHFARSIASTEAGNSALLDKPKMLRLWSWLFGLLAFEIFLAIELLPIGFIMQAALLLLFIVLGTDLLRKHLEGSLTTNYVLRAVTVLIFATLVIFASARWEL